jgi:glycosyltransferase involved in cell wall biosynthesis
MDIAFIADPDSVNTNYRTYQPMDALARRGHEVRHNAKGEDRLRVLRRQMDVVHIHRYIDDELFLAVRRVKEQGVGVVWDNDDDVLSVPKQNPRYKKYGGPRQRQTTAGVARMVQLADVVTTPSAVLAAQYRRLGATDVRVLENYLPPQFSGVRPRKHDGIVIGWIAGLEHQLDYQALRLREILLQLLESHSDLKIHSVGLGLGLPAESYECIPLCAFLELARIAAGYDIGIAPLADVPFSRARSNVKLKEYAAAGVPWLASSVGPYAGLGEAQGGRLVAADRWREELERLLLGARDRHKLAKRAVKWSRSQGIDKNVDGWEIAFRDAATRSGQSRSR